jgi:hypothetical protein
VSRARRMTRTRLALSAVAVSVVALLAAYLVVRFVVLEPEPFHDPDAPAIPAPG